MTIRSICSREVELAEPGETAQVAGQRMLSRNVGTLIVVDEDRRPAGILTDRDLALRVVGEGREPNRTCVADVMTVGVTTVYEEGSMGSTLATMSLHGVRRLVVVDDKDRLVGVISLDDILTFLAEELGQASALLKKTSLQSAAV